MNKTMRSKNISFGLILGFMIMTVTGCFPQPDISVPNFIPKTPPDSVVERGIDAHPDNAIYLEWEEPATAEEEGILGYYIYRGKLVNEDYVFSRIASVQRNEGLLYDSDSYVDYSVHLDTTYYYYLKSYNDFAVSKETSDTAQYKLTHKPTPVSPAGDITSINQFFEFIYPLRTIDRVNYLYFRLYYFENSTYQIKLFAKKHRFDLSQSTFHIYLKNNDSHTTVLMDSLWTDTEEKRYLEKGTYRWRVDAVSGQLGGAPETEGSESAWMYFTVK